MVNQLTALQKIIQLIHTENLTPMRKWSERFRISKHNNYSCYLSRMRKVITEILNLISGNDLVSMLKDILDHKQKEQFSLNYQNALKNLTVYYEKIDLKKRHFFVRPLKEAGLKYQQIRRLGFPVSRHLWKTTEDETKRAKGGGRSIPQDLKDSIFSYLNQHSSIASNRLAVCRNKESEEFLQKNPVRYLDNQETELFKTSPFVSEISKSTFHKYLKLNGVFKRPHRWTDLCDYCEKNKKLKVELVDTLEKVNFEWLDSFNIENLIDVFLQKRSEFENISMQNFNQRIIEDKLNTDRILNTLKDIQTIDFHQNVARNQRKIYNFQLKNKDFLKDKVLIECDFKQKILIGMSPRQVNNEYYSQKTRSCLGFGIYYEKENEISSINFDIISSDLSEDARAVVRGFRLLRCQEFFKNIDKKSYVIWMDCGKHFRNSEVIGYLLKELAEEKINGMNKVNTVAIELDFETDLYLKNNLSSICNVKIQNVESFYNYQTIDDDFKIVSTVLSGEPNYIELKLKGSNKKNFNKSYQVLPEEKLVEDDPNLLNLKLKKSRINSALSKIKVNLDEHGKNTENSFFDFFCLKKQELDTRNLQKPIFCNNFRGKSCTECKEICSFSMDMILHPINPISQPDILEELRIHGHPSSRIMPNGKARLTNEAAEELAEHYIYAHKIKRPTFFY